MNNQKPQLDMKVASVVKGLAFAENGGIPDVSNPSQGQTGEMKSIFQFTPDTWKNYAQQVSGKADLPMTPENESLVAYHKVGDWMQKGYTVPQIASMWNAGVGEPNAYTGKFSDGSSSTGINKKYGVKYDVPGYAKKVADYAQQFSQESPEQQPMKQAQDISLKKQTQSASVKPKVNKPGLLHDFMSSRTTHPQHDNNKSKKFLAS